MECISIKFDMRICKRKNSEVLNIMGGPEFPAGTGQRSIKNSDADRTYDKCFQYLLDRPSIDYFAYVDGEVAFVEILNKYIENNFSTSSLKSLDKPLDGCANIFR